MYFIYVYMTLLTVISFTLGFGLRNLRSWARWITAVLIVLSLLANLVGLVFQASRGADVAGSVGQLLGSAIIPGYILYLLLSAKGSMVFSPEYQTIIARTPHVKMKTSWLVKGCLIALVACLTLGVLGALMSYLSRSR
jgi:hypothetical protein